MIILDIETTGLSPLTEEITEIGALKVVDGKIVETFSQLINPGKPISARITEITGITDEMVKDKPGIDVVLPQFLDFCGDDFIVGHNVGFDYGFLRVNAEKLKLRFVKQGLDTLKITSCLYPELPSKSLTNLIKTFDIDRTNAHRAFDDAKATYELLAILAQHPRMSVNKKLFEPKPLPFKVSKPSPITPKQVKFLEALCEQHEVVLDRAISTLTKSEASREIDRILSHHGR